MKFTTLAPSVRCWMAVFLAGWSAPGTARGVGEWREVLWGGAKAWAATSGGWTAVVSEARARLVCLEPVGGGNLLYAPAKTEEERSWGGHRFWLGPQSQWRPDWPPPADWESSACAEVHVLGKRLELLHRNTDKRYPQLARGYYWSGGVLHCEVRWQGDCYHAIQIFQLPAWALVHVRRTVTKKFPKGYALMPIYGRPDILTDADIAPGVNRAEGARVTLWRANVFEKVAFFPQDIVADIGDYGLILRRGLSEGLSKSVPDEGLLSQVYLGGWEDPFIEIEQISAYGGGQQSLFEVQIKPVRLKH